MSETSPESIARDFADYLQENRDVCADVSVSAGTHPWVRYNGEWQYAEYAKYGRVIGHVSDLESIVALFAGNPVNLIPCSEAYQWSPPNDTVWEDADEQDVFTNLDRCEWCGHSERTRNLSAYESVNDGEVTLCESCSHSWADAGELVSPNLHGSA